MKNYIVVVVDSYKHKIIAKSTKVFKSRGLAFIYMSKIYYDLLHEWIFMFHEDVDLIDCGINDSGAWLENENNTERYDWYIEEVETEE